MIDENTETAPKGQVIRIAGDPWKAPLVQAKGRAGRRNTRCLAVVGNCRLAAGTTTTRKDHTRRSVAVTLQTVPDPRFLGKVKRRTWH